MYFWMLPNKQSRLNMFKDTSYILSQIQTKFVHTRHHIFNFSCATRAEGAAFISNF